LIVTWWILRIWCSGCCVAISSVSFTFLVGAPYEISISGFDAISPTGSSSEDIRLSFSLVVYRAASLRRLSLVSFSSGFFLGMGLLYFIACLKCSLLGFSSTAGAFFFSLVTFETSETVGAFGGLLLPFTAFLSFG